MKARAGLAVLAAGVLMAGAASLGRPGYSPDEEYTLFAIRGIHAHGLPLLPSGLLYDRGLIYSYAGWLTGVVSGQELPAYRAVSLFAAVVALVVLVTCVRRIASASAAWIAVALVATSLPFWAVATTARFYAPFLASSLAVLAFLARSAEAGTSGAPGTFGTLGTLRSSATLCILAALCRLTHELSFALVAIPAVAIVVDDRAQRGYWRRAGLALIVGLAAAQALLLAVHTVAPQSGESMAAHFYLWPVLNFFKTPPALQVGVPLVAMVIGWLLVPQRAGLIFVTGMCGAALVLGAAVSRAAVGATVTPALLASVVAESARYPLDMFWQIARTSPVALVLALTLLVARVVGAAGPWSAGERAVHLGWVGWVACFGVMDAGVTISYASLPVTLMLVALAIDTASIVRRHGTAGRRVAAAGTAVVVLAAVVVDAWRGGGSPAGRLEAARPTIHVPGIDAVRASFTPTDKVACTDELACLVLVGRADAWLALDDYVRERFVVRPGGAPTGVYAGAPAVFHPADLFPTEASSPRTTRVLVVDVFKDYPIGNSRVWLPRAIEEDGLESRTLLETPQARVVELSRPAQNALLPGAGARE